MEKEQITLRELDEFDNEEDDGLSTITRAILTPQNRCAIQQWNEEDERQDY